MSNNDDQNVVEKPPTQGVGVQGFSADVYAADEVKVDWTRLIQIPKFQMFACEISGLHHSNVMQWIAPFVRDNVKQSGDKALFDHYAAWHANKHYWDNETLYGELKEG